MIIEFVHRKYAEIPCDLLAYPLFEDEAEDAPAVVALDKATGGVVRAVRSSGGFKPKLHSTCLIHGPRGLKANRPAASGRRQEAGVESCPVEALHRHRGTECKVRCL